MLFTFNFNYLFKKNIFNNKSQCFYSSKTMFFKSNSFLISSINLKKNLYYDVKFLSLNSKLLFNKFNSFNLIKFFLFYNNVRSFSFLSFYYFFFNSFFFNWFLLFFIKLNYFKRSNICYSFFQYFSIYVYIYNFNNFSLVFKYNEIITLYLYSVLNKNLLFICHSYSFKFFGLLFFFRRLFWSYYLYLNFISYLDLYDFVKYSNYFYLNPVFLNYIDNICSLFSKFSVNFLYFIKNLYLKFSLYIHELDFSILKRFQLNSLSLWLCFDRSNIKHSSFLFNNFLFRFVGYLIKKGLRFLSFRLLQFFFWKIKFYNLNKFNFIFNNFFTLSNVFSSYLLKIKLTSASIRGKSIFLPKLVPIKFLIPSFLSIFVKQSRLREDRYFLLSLFSEFLDLITGKGNTVKFILSTYKTSLLNLKLSGLLSRNISSILLSRLLLTRTVLKGSRRIKLAQDFYHIY